MFGALRAQKQLSAPEAEWCVLQTPDNRYIIRCNLSVVTIAGSPQYKIRVLVKAAFHTPTENGMPEAAESQELYDVEDAVCDRFEAAGFALLVLTMVGNNAKEMIFYAKDGDRAKELLAELRAQISSHKIQHNITEDAEWSTYRRFVVAQ